MSKYNNEQRTANSEQRTANSDNNFARDKDYWNEFYSEKGQKILKPSDFAISVMKELERDKNILDLGCGNGRDSIYFLENGMNVTGIDASDVAIKNLKNITKGNNKANFICGDFVTCPEIYNSKFDYIYSRFTLHAINQSQQNEMLINVRKILKPEGILFIEARTIHDDLYGIGECIAEDTFIHDSHFRRFIRPEKLEKEMTSMGYKIISLIEDRGFSKFQDSDPVLLRIIATVDSKI